MGLTTSMTVVPATAAGWPELESNGDTIVSAAMCRFIEEGRGL